MTDTPALDVHCPHCEARYLLPAHLLGPGGAHVRCPACGNGFDVEPPAAEASGSSTLEPRTVEPLPAPAPAPAAASARVAPAPPPAAARAAAPAPAAGTDAEHAPIHVARVLLAALAEREEAGIEQAVLDGALFARYGPALFALYDEYRRRARGAGPNPFRAALQERWGVDLPEVTPRP